MIDAERLHRLAPKCDAEAWAPALQAAAERWDIDTPLRRVHWLAQLAHEAAGFTRLTENLNYSVERLMAVWPARFPSIMEAAKYAHQPAKLAERVYGSRLGNREPGDGAKFIGRGVVQLTGRANYERYGAMIGVDLVAHPERAAEPETAAQLAGAYWASRGLNAKADADDLTGITRAINGGLMGIVDRRKLLNRAKLIWGVHLEPPDARTT